MRDASEPRALASGSGGASQRAASSFPLTSTKTFVYYRAVKKKAQLPRPTEAELEILGVLWERGASTVRDVADVLGEQREIGYTTVLKLMQIMDAKGLVTRDEANRAHIYKARIPRDQTQKQLLKHLVERAFGGSAMQLVQQALASADKVSPEELAEIRKMLDGFERSKK